MTLALMIDLLGWIGALVVLTAYALLSARRLEGHSGWYQGLNIQGSLCLLINAAYHRAFPSAFVNLIWVLIGVAAWLFYWKTTAKMPPVGNEPSAPTESQL